MISGTRAFRFVVFSHKDNYRRSRYIYTSANPLAPGCLIRREVVSKVWYGSTPLRFDSAAAFLNRKLPGYGKRQISVVPYSVLEDTVRVFDSARPGYWRQEKSLRQLFDETIPVMHRMIDQWLERNPQ